MPKTLKVSDDTNRRLLAVMQEKIKDLAAVLAMLGKQGLSYDSVISCLLDFWESEHSKKK
jgi:hypothetical protein